MPSYRPKNIDTIEAYASEDDADVEDFLTDLD
jgi:hypothetical protein